MGDLELLHSQATRLTLRLKDGLEKLEAGEASSRVADPVKLAADLRKELNDLQRISHELESVWRMHVVRENNTKRTAWKGKVEKVVADVMDLQRGLDKYGGRERRAEAERAMREELLGRGEAGRRAKTEADAEAAMAGSVTNAKRALEEMYETGGHILASMGANRERLKRAHRKVLDVINSVGLGETLLRLIERKQRMDIWITYGGMLAVLLFTLLLLWWAWG